MNKNKYTILLIKLEIARKLKIMKKIFYLFWNFFLLHKIILILRIKFYQILRNFFSSLWVNKIEQADVL